MTIKEKGGVWSWGKLCMGWEKETILSVVRPERMEINMPTKSMILVANRAAGQS